VSISFALLDSSNAPSAHALLRQWWRQNWSEEFSDKFFAWRYLARPWGETLLAFDKGRCVGILDSFLRTYLLFGRRITVRETCDWFCTPEYRPQGLGLRLMRKLMINPEPIIVVGGEQTTQSLLPRLKFERLPDVSNCFLPISVKAFMAMKLHRLGHGEALTRFIPSRLTLTRPRRMMPLLSGEVRVSAREVAPPPPGEAYALASVLAKETLEWQTAAPEEIGILIALNFLVDDVLVATSMSRVERHEEGMRAKVLHLQCAAPSSPIIDWAVSETVQHLVKRGAVFISCWSSCPLMSAALQRVGFRAGSPRPVFWWPAQTRSLCGAMHLTMARADDALWDY
jgi:Acetyltransferase (GNAT) family